MRRLPDARLPRPERATIDGSRLRSLDGVRGIASVVVLLYHAFLLAQPHLPGWPDASSMAPGTLHWWLYASPLSVLVSGEQAVLVFFLLSGIVLTLPVLKAARFSWAAYYPRRLVRLYVPVIGSVLLGAAFLLAVPRTQPPAPAWQWTDNAHGFDLGGAVTAAALVNPRPAINGPLWSLSWEVAFSVALPLFVLVALRVGRWWPLAVAGAVLLVDAGFAWDFSPAKYLPVFLVGALAAVHLDRVTAVAQRLTGSSRHALWWALVLGGSILLVTAHRASPTLLAGRNTWVTVVLQGLVVVGCMELVLVALGSAGAQRVLESRPVQWTGQLSFSLYLVHVPLLLAVASAVGWDRWGLALLIGVPASLGLAAAFMWLVEQPAHRLAKRAGRLAGGRRPRAEPAMQTAQRSEIR